MLNAAVSINDILWIIEIVVVLIAMYVSYNEGRKRGYEEGRKHYRRKSRHKYTLPVKDITPEQFSSILNILDRSYDKSDVYRIRLSRKNKKNRGDYRRHE